MSKNITGEIDLLQKLKDLDCYNFDNDPLKASILFRTMLFIDSLHDFTDYKRFKHPNNENNAKDIITLLTKKFKEECKYLINKFPEHPLKKLIILFHDEYSIQFLYELDVIRNKSREVQNKHFNEINRVKNLKDIGTISGNIKSIGKEITIKIKQDLINKIIYFYFTNYIPFNDKFKIVPNKEKPISQNIPMYNYYEDELIKQNHNAGDINNLCFILNIARLLHKIKLSNLAIQNSLDIYSKSIHRLFGLIDINFIQKEDQATNITNWGFVHGMLCIKKNKYKKKFNEEEDECCKFEGKNAYLPNIIFTVDADGNNTSCNYITELIKMLSKDKEKNLKNIHLIKTKATNFDGAYTTQFFKYEDLNNLIENHKLSPQENNLDITLKCGSIDLIKLKYTNNTKVNITKWFGENVTNKSKEVNNKGYTLNDAIVNFLHDKDPFSLYFKTICDLGQILAFTSYQEHLDENISKKYIFFLHTIDGFAGQIGSLIHPGIVIENHSSINVRQEFPNTFYISSSQINEKIDLSAFPIKWQTIDPSITYNAREIDKLIKKSNSDFEEKIQDLHNENFKLLKDLIESDLKLAHERIKTVENELDFNIYDLQNQLEKTKLEIKYLKSKRDKTLKKLHNNKSITRAKKKEYAVRSNKYLNNIIEKRNKKESIINEIKRLKNIKITPDDITYLENSSSSSNNSSIQYSETAIPEHIYDLEDTPIYPKSLQALVNVEKSKPPKKRQKFIYGSSPPIPPHRNAKRPRSSDGSPPPTKKQAVGKKKLTRKVKRKKKI